MSGSVKLKLYSHNHTMQVINLECGGREYRFDGVLHRGYGQPAVERGNGALEWWTYGVMTRATSPRANPPDRWAAELRDFEELELMYARRDRIMSAYSRDDKWQKR